MKTFNYLIFSLLVVALVACQDKKKDVLPPGSNSICDTEHDPGILTTTINVYIENGTVRLSSNGNAKVRPNTYVQWNAVGPHLSITNIRPEIRAGQTNIWVEQPCARNRQGRVWRGLVFGQEGSEYYYVDYEINDGGTTTTGTIDPVISVDPEP